MLEALPQPVRAVLAALWERGHLAVLVGGCVRDALRALPVRDYDVATAASADEVLAIFPRGVPLGIRFGTVMVPTAAGPVDVTSLRGPDLPSDLAHRDFTLNAMAFDPKTGALLDPWGGAADLANGILRATRSADERLAEDPVRALRAARLCAEFCLNVDPELEAALPAAGPRLGSVATERIRNELERLLEVPDPGPGIALLRRSQLEQRVLPGARPDAGELIRRLPRDATLRLAAWLRGTRVPALLAALRIPRARAREVERLLAIHPAEVCAGRGDAGARRLRKKARDPVTLERALLLRQAELELAAASGAVSTEARALEDLRERLERTRQAPVARSDLALSGRQVMTLLEIDAGPRVGEALRYLEEQVLEDPTRNEPDALAELLRGWWRDGEPRDRPAPGRPGR
jgi:tRNA nucleotidyltransferase (CCA-adding enzyme)